MLRNRRELGYDRNCKPMSADNDMRISEPYTAQRGLRAGLQPGGYLITVSLIMSVAISVSADFNATHLFNPAWPPHAKFHDAAMLNLLTGVSVLALWLLWRRSREPHVAANVAGLIPIIFWSAFFWVSLVIPGASLQAVEGEPPRIGGIVVLPNVIAAFVFVLMSVAGLWRRRLLQVQNFQSSRA